MQHRHLTPEHELQINHIKPSAKLGADLAQPADLSKA
jgi:hypothetical protein